MIDTHEYNITRRDEIYDLEKKHLNIKITNEIEMHQLRLKHEQELHDIRKRKLESE